MWLARPRRAELRPERDNEEYAKTLDALDCQRQQLLRGGIDPVHVLVRQEHWLLHRKPCEPVLQRLEQQLLLTLRRQVERG